MGTWTRNFLLPKTNPFEVREVVVNWLERKGFELQQSNNLLPTDDNDGRSVYLISNTKWCGIIYSQAFEEGDRLLSELHKFPTSLEVWIADSDVWGYSLYEKGELTAAFNSHPGFFGREEIPLPKNGDAARLCSVLGLEDTMSKLQAAQRKRSLFSDIPCQKFCRILDALPGTIPPADMEYWNQGRVEIRELGGWTIEPLLFAKWKGLAQEEPEPVLHGMTTRSFRPQEPRTSGIQLDPEFEAAMRQRIQVLTWIFKPIGWVLAAPFVLTIWLQRLGFSKPKKRSTGRGDLLEELSNAPDAWRREAEWLVNERHRCRIKVSEPADAKQLFKPINEVFHFQLNGTEVSCLCIPQAQLRRHFDLQPTQEAVRDESFFVGSLPARLLVVATNQQGKKLFRCVWFIERGGVAYEFMAHGAAELNQETVERISLVVKSFELVGDRR